MQPDHKRAFTEPVMSEIVLSILISCAILAGLAIWVPTLHLCHGCLQRLFSAQTRIGLGEVQPTPEAGVVKAA